MLAEPQLELERICQFPGYDGAPEWKVDREAQNVYSERMRKSRWRDAIVDAPVLREIRRKLIPKSAREWVKSLWTMKEKPKLNSQQTEKLRAVFDEDLCRLGSWLGAELNCENY